MALVCFGFLFCLTGFAFGWLWFGLGLLWVGLGLLLVGFGSGWVCFGLALGWLGIALGLAGLGLANFLKNTPPKSLQKSGPSCLYWMTFCHLLPDAIFWCMTWVCVGPGVAQLGLALGWLWAGLGLAWVGSGLHLLPQ